MCTLTVFNGLSINFYIPAKKDKRRYVGLLVVQLPNPHVRIVQTLACLRSMNTTLARTQYPTFLENKILRIRVFWYSLKYHRDLFILYFFSYTQNVCLCISMCICMSLCRSYWCRFSLTIIHSVYIRTCYHTIVFNRPNFLQNSGKNLQLNDIYAKWR